MTNTATKLKRALCSIAEMPAMRASITTILHSARLSFDAVFVMLFFSF